MRRSATLLAVLLGLVLPGAAAAWNGERAPNDPEYAIAELDPVNHSWSEEQWFMYSFLPRTAPQAGDPEGAAGMSVDRAWARAGTGRPDVRIAYIEGGVNWRTESARQELAGRTYLNAGELPPPLGAAAHDADGDGQVDVEDYAGDPRVGRLHGSITPEDLIVAFSDGRDDDGNGYVDDISGWNFSRANNDPQTEDSAYTHANNQMERAAGEGDNGVGGVGMCPRCTLIPIKVADEALVRTDRLAQAIFFAVDSGASVIVAVTAELGYSELARRALDYAWDRGVVVVMASNDFNSADHQGGMFWPRVWPGNGLVGDTASRFPSRAGDLAVRSFRHRSNYTSFGTHNLFSAPSRGGTTSESTPTLGGVAALVVAAGRSAAERGRIARPLTAGEVREVVRSTISPITEPGLNRPVRPGATFSLHFGYGRPQVDRAVQAVDEGRIPPVPDIVAPDWYALHDPTRERQVPIRVALDARRAQGAAFRIEWALGAEPTEEEFRTLRTGTVRGGRSTLTAQLRLDEIPRSVWEQPLEYTEDLRSTEQHTVTLRVRVRDGRGNVGEDRRAIAVFHDPAARAGFPRRLGLGSDAQPTPADLDGDGDDELVFGDGNGFVHALDGGGGELPGWPAQTAPLELGLQDTRAGRAGAVPAAREPVLAAAAVGDLDADGRPEVAVTSTSGRTYVFDAAGALRPGWPQTLGADRAALSVPPPDRPFARLPSLGAFAAPVLAPLRGGGVLDVVQAGWDGRVHAFAADGSAVPGWPVEAKLPAAAEPGWPFTYVQDRKLIATPTVAQLDGTGPPEIVIKSQEFALGVQDLLGLGSQFYVQAFWADGTNHAGGPIVPGWPARVPGLLGAYGVGQDWLAEGGDSASAADLDGDGRDEVVQPTVFGGPAVITTAPGGAPAAASATAAVAATRPRGAAATLQRAARTRDADLARRALRDAAHERRAARGPDTARMAADPAPFSLLRVGFTTSGAFGVFDGRPSWATAGTDLLSLSSIIFPGTSLRISNWQRLLDPRGVTEHPGFPQPLMGLPFLTAPAIADISGDGRPDLVNASDTSNIAAWGPDGAAVAGWPKFTGGWAFATPAVADLDGNGAVEVVATTREGYLFAWDTAGRRADVQVPTWHQDAAHTGRLGGAAARP